MPYTKDAAADLLAFAQSQQAIIERETFSEARDMADIVYSQFVPIVGGNELAQSVLYVSSKNAGQAEFINANADDVPMADTQLDVKPQLVYTAAIGYGWGWEELLRARSMGVSLQADRAFAARRAYEEMVQRLVFEGDSRRNMTGLLGVTTAGTQVTTGFTGAWSTSSPAADAATIAKDLITLMRGTGRGNQATANRIVLPAKEFTHASVTFFANSSMTAIDLIRQRYPGVQITSREALDSTGGGGNSFKYLAYRYDPTSLAFYLPMPLRFMPVYQAGPLRFEVPGVFRAAGLNVKRKEDFAYATASNQ